MKIYVMSFHGDVVRKYPAFTSRQEAENFQKTVAKGCFVDTMDLQKGLSDAQESHGARVEARQKYNGTHAYPDEN